MSKFWLDFCTKPVKANYQTNGRDLYVIVDIPNPDIPVYKVQKESREGEVRTLHRNLLLPFKSISDAVDTELTNNNTLHTVVH